MTTEERNDIPQAEAWSNIKEMIETRPDNEIHIDFNENGTIRIRVVGGLINGDV